MVHFLFLTLPMCAFCINLVFNICMWLDGKSGKARDVAVPRLRHCGDERVYQNAIFSGVETWRAASR